MKSRFVRRRSARHSRTSHRLATGTGPLAVRARRLALEPLENRLLLSTVFSVTNTSDSGLGSLRQAILDANSMTGTDTIAFAIPGTGPHTIQPLSPLPTITDPVVIDGYTQPGASPNSNPAGSELNTVLMIELDGSRMATGYHGLTITSGSSTVRGLAINGFRDIGVLLHGMGRNAVQGNFIGTDVTGTIAKANVTHGVQIMSGSQYNTIGTDGDGRNDVAEMNLISGNGHIGIVIVDAGTDYNVVAGNFIGTDRTGIIALGNDRGMAILAGAQFNVVGTNGDGVSDVAERNVISGNRDYGMWIGDPGTDHNVVAGNYIGIDRTGMVALGNAGQGVTVYGGAALNRIGTNGDGIADSAERNIISGNGSDGVQIAHAGTDNNVVAGNFIGTDVTGTAALGNGRDGVLVWYGPKSNRIGTNGDGIADAAERNIISASGKTGVVIRDVGTNHNTLAGNFIGTDVTGTIALGNATEGVLVYKGAQFNVIGTDGDGTADESERNIISGNASIGVRIGDPGTDQNVVAGNFIGTDVTGSNALSNGGNGVEIARGAQFNVIGTDGDGLFDASERNVISGNDWIGVKIVDHQTSDNVVAGNLIGTDVSGAVALANGGPGVGIRTGAQSNRVGTNGDGVADAAERNVISGNAHEGVWIQGDGASYNVVAGNYIGTDASGSVALGNGMTGIRIRAGAQGNLIGTDGDGVADEAEANVISGNSAGVTIHDPGADFNIVAGNFIGTDLTGAASLGNASNGVIIKAGAQFNVIGTDGDGIADEAERNIISGNDYHGVQIADPGTDGNVVAGNFIGTDVTGTAPVGNGVRGIDLWSGAARNLIGTDADGVADESEGNLISGNLQAGVAIGGVGTLQNVVAGNLIGTDRTGSFAIGNAFHGVAIWSGAAENRIGTNGSDAERNVISGNVASGIAIYDPGSNDNTVAGNYIGTDFRGTAALGNGGHGVLVSNGAKSNLIGTNGDGLADTAERNIISGNADGVVIWGPGTQQNIVAGNRVGTDVTGAIALGNAGQGVVVYGGAASNRVGTNGDGSGDAAEGNLISGNGWNGVGIGDPGTDHNVVAGNLIGSDANGLIALGNKGDGVWIVNGAKSNRIGTNGDGTADSAERNIISGNGSNGIWIQGAGADQNVVAGNFIGIDATGSGALSNGGNGILINGSASLNLVGTDGDGIFDAAESNVISGNSKDGVFIHGLASFSTVAGNFIGTDVTGTVAVPNIIDGIDLASALQSQIGTDGNGIADEAEGNVISGNGRHGVVVRGAAAIDNTVAGNYIGTDATGEFAIGNASNGVLVNLEAKRTRIGTNGDGLADEAERNVISGNSQHGVNITGKAESNIVAGNYIGTDVSGSIAVGNGSHGVEVSGGAQFNWIGTNGDGVGDVAERNVISGNSRGAATYPYGSGILIGNAGTDDNVVAGNFIGTDATGTKALGNGYYGVWVASGAKANRIDRNTISANLKSGIAIKNSGTENNVVSGNFIGTDMAGTSALPNGGHGVQIYWGANNNCIGTNGDGVTDEAERNLISGNVLAGVAVSVDAPSGNRIQGNSIHANGGLGIDLGGYGVTPNDPGDSDAGANNLQNYPEISLARPGATTRVAGDLNSTPNTTFTLDFYAGSEADPSGFGEGERWLDSALVTTDAAGNVSFDVVLAAATVSGEVITATATDPGGNTSEFSNADVLARMVVQIDVKPGSDSNPINLVSKGVIAVAILTTEDFDASLVDATSVVFAGASMVKNVIEDIDGDGDLDMVLHFDVNDTNLADLYALLLADDINGDGVMDSKRQTAAISLTGQTVDDAFFEGFDDLDLFLSGKNLRDLLEDLVAAGAISG